MLLPSDQDWGSVTGASASVSSILVIQNNHSKSLCRFQPQNLINFRKRIEFPVKVCGHPDTDFKMAVAGRVLSASLWRQGLRGAWKGID